ncbi:Na+/melibiose symporter-like transporter [Allocatelliglobosispora scoriae]|uniref:Na+/melibiose symporter-like transporter n=1 Tax=Allocatelliglobosispora scoriae TaxID=643052 RepID=A0A841BKN8_9ACTN|nr:MFS transporter [Allocatelliglobosispora scoriae]MBB5868844.1 Na+/melibiose symporter-like transporter [Allocatelliglobosispora scoriae]
MTESAPTQRLPRSGLLAFAGGSIGMGVWVTVPGLLLLYFLTDVLAVSPLLAGFVLLLPKIADVLLHPWVGHLSDTDLRKRGHRRGLMLLGCGLPFAFAGLFALPAGLTGTTAAIWVMVFFIAGNLLFATYQVPYLSTPADLAIGYHERTRLMGFRMVVLTLGILLSGVIAPIISGKDNPTRGGYALMGAILGAVMLGAMLIGLRGVRTLTTVAPTPPVAAPTHAAGLRTLLAALGDRQFRWLVAAYLLMSTTTHLVLTAVPYFAEYELGKPGLTTVLVAAFVAPALIATPGWVWLTKRIGKQPGLLIAQLAFAAGSVVLAFGRPVGVPILVGCVAVLGVAFAAMQLLPFSMLPDVVRAGGAAGTARAGSYTGMWTAAEATGGALGPYLYAACLAVGGFIATGAGEQVVQSERAHDLIRLGFGVVPAVLMVVAVLLQRQYTLDARLRDASPTV